MGVRFVPEHGNGSRLSVGWGALICGARGPVRHDRPERQRASRMAGPRILPGLDRAYILPSVSSASRTCASVKLDVLGYF